VRERHRRPSSGGLCHVYIRKRQWGARSDERAAYGVGIRRTRHPARVAAKSLKVTGAGTIRKQAAKRKNL
jgi:hypothetical protein